jgi:ketosteroid isomerase-like protein
MLVSFVRRKKMKKMSLWIAVFLMLALAGCTAAPAPVTENATAEFKPLAEKMTAAWAALDVDKAAPFYAKDAGLVFYDAAPLKYTGWNEYAQGSKKTFAEWKSLQMELGADFQAFKRGDIAWWTYTTHIEVETKAGGKMSMDVRGTDILEKRGADWLIVHEHFSTPLPEPPPAPAAKG